MTIKTVLQKGSVVVATLGLSTCNDNGAVDPAPPPLSCPAVGDGGTLFVDAKIIGNQLEIEFQETQFETVWTAPLTVTNLTGATLVSTTAESARSSAVVVLGLGSPMSTSGSFTISGTVTDGDDDCAVTKTYTFTITNGQAEVALNERSLPLERRGRSNILLEGRDGRAVELAVGGNIRGGRVEWTATAGAIVVREDGKITWQLPEEPGLYQVEVAVDHGAKGILFDTLTLEVT